MVRKDQNRNLEVPGSLRAPERQTRRLDTKQKYLEEDHP